MPDSFFVSDKKRKRSNKAGPSTSRPARGRGGSRGGRTQGRTTQRDEDVSSASSDAGGGDLDTMDFRAGREDVPLSDEEAIDEYETAAEKRVRLAKGYLNKVREDLEAANKEDDFDAAEIDRELIASRLQKDVAETQGRIHTYIGSSLNRYKSRLFTTPSHAPTSVAISQTSLFVATKRGQIIRYSLPSLQKVGTPFGQAKVSGPKAKSKALDQGHKGEILCLAASEDGRYLVSGGRDRVVGVWNVEGDEAKWITGMRGHKDAITQSVSIPALDNPAYHVLTASLSRHLALASLSTLAVIDTFFGHQDAITDVSALKPSAAVTAGSRDRTCRWWKVEEEMQLVFRGGGRTFENFQGIAPAERKERLGGGWEVEKEDDAKKREQLEKKGKGKGKEFVEGSIDCVCMLDDQHFVSGGDSGSISLWHTGKKKPIYTQHLAHGTVDLAEEAEIKGARWITSLAALRGTDIFASGSWNGEIKLWTLDRNLRNFAPAAIASIPVVGFVNSLQFISLSSGGIDTSGANWQSTTLADQNASEDNAVISSGDKEEYVLVGAISQEPRLGRWMRHKEGVKNGAVVVHLSS